jgi:hypothetical protein
VPCLNFGVIGNPWAYIEEKEEILEQIGGITLN